MKTNRTAIFLAALLAVSSVAACGDSKAPVDGDQTTVDTNDTLENGGYSFSKEYSGEDIYILNIDDCYSMHARIDTKETNGDTLNDTQYNAVRKLEEQMGITWNESNYEVLDGMPEMVRQTIAAGEDEYDIIYQSNSKYYYAFASEGYYYNLLDFDELQLDKEWWLDTFNNTMTLNGKLYSALGYSHLCCIDAISMLYFNQDMVEKLKLDMPYDLVRNGTWTIDKLAEYCKAAANLNGDESFKWVDDGSAVWGLSIPSNSGANWLHYLGEGVIINDSGKAVLNAGTSDRFYTACEKIANLFSLTEDGSVYMGHFNGDDAPGSYINAFESQRALFGASEIAKANRMRNLDFTFGALPYPKLDETQDRYYESLSYPACGVAIPVTCKTAERSAVIGDAINYIYYTDVWPVFSEVTLKAKNLRNDDSIEMLGIILESAVAKLGDVYDIGTDYTNKLSEKLRAGDIAVASLLASYEEAINLQLEKVNNQD